MTAKPYQVVCISIYDEDVAALADKVAALKARGFRRANKSWLIRVALAKLDLDRVEAADAAR
jgi:hypothetical protein